MNVEDETQTLPQEQPPAQPIRIAIELWLDIASRAKVARLIFPDGNGGEFQIEINYVLLNQFAHICTDALSFPDSNLTPEKILAGQITFPHVDPTDPTPPTQVRRGAGSLTRVPMPIPPPQNPT